MKIKKKLINKDDKVALRFIQGDAKTNFLDVIVDLILKIPENEDIFLIVPNNLKFKAEIEVLNRLRRHKQSNDDLHFFSLPNLKIYSFNRLVWYFLNDSTYFQLPELTVSLKNMILTAILQTKNEQLKVYHNFAGDTGFIDLLRKQIESFQNENLSADDLAKAEINDIDPDKKSDLVLIYQEYERVIDQPFRDEQCDFIKLRTYLKQKDLTKTNFIFYNYLQFTKVEFDLFTLFLKKANNVYYLGYFDKVLRDKTLINNLPETITPEITSFSTKTNNNIASVFLNHKFEKNKDISNIEIFYMKNRYDEVKKIALEISHLVRYKNVRYSDILVVGPDLDQYQVIFKEIFGNYHIPYFGQFTNSMEGSAITYFLKKILALVTFKIQLHDIFDLLKTGLLFNDKILSQTALFDAENFSLLLGISGYDFLYLDLNENSLKRTFSNQIDHLTHFLLVRKLTRNLLLPLIGHLKHSKTARQYANIIYNFCEQSEVFNNLNLRKSTAYQNQQQLVGDRINQEVNNFSKLLDEIITVFQDQEISLNDFSQILINGFKTKTYQLVPAVIDAVQISEVNKVNLPSYRYVWIFNASDGNFPLNHDRNELLLSSEEIEAIAHATNNQFLLRYVMNYQNLMERNIDYLMMSLPQKKLYLSFPSQIDDNLMLPSTYITQLQDNFNISLQNFSDEPKNDDFSNRLLLPETSLTDLVQVLRESLIEQEPLKTAWSTLFYWYKKQRPQDLEIVLRALNLQERHQVDPEIIKNIFEQDLFLSITNMETYFRNPYEFFVKYVLKVKERPVSEINAVVSGLIFHQSLDLFFKYLKNKKKLISNLSNSDLREISHQVYQQTIKLQNLEFLMNDPINQFNIIIIEQTILKTLESFKSQGLRSRTLFTEKSFGTMGDEIQPIFNLGSGRKLRINGKIDRLDLFKSAHQEFFNVIDYKSSNRKFNLNDFYSGLDIQLITYLQILKDYYFTDSKQHVGGSFFYQVQDPQVSYEKVKKDPKHAWLKNFQYNGIYSNNPDYQDLIIQDLSKNNFKWNDFFPSNNRFSKSAYRPDEFKLIFAYNRKRFKTLADLIYAGEFSQKILFRTFADILNYRSDPYQAILLFDPEIDHDFQVLKSKTAEELLKLMRDELNE